jgi:hypothetical protein
MGAAGTTWAMSGADADGDRAVALIVVGFLPALIGPRVSRMRGAPSSVDAVTPVRVESVSQHAPSSSAADRVTIVTPVGFERCRVNIDAGFGVHVACSPGRAAPSPGVPSGFVAWRRSCSR